MQSILIVMRFGFLAALTAVLFLWGCSKIPPANDLCVPMVVQSRIGQEVVWNFSPCLPCETRCFIEACLKEELNADLAVQIALLNNPSIQALFEELGIAHADLVEAGLFKNPIFDFTARFPNKAGLVTDFEYSVTACFLDLFLVPLRKRVAAAEFEEAKFRVSHAILALAFEAQEVFYALQADLARLNYLEEISELWKLKAEVNSRELAVGNIYKLDFQFQEVRVLEAELEIDRIKAEVARDKERLNKLLGLCADAYLRVPNKLPNPRDYLEYDLCILEQRALQERLDLQEARWEVARLARMLPTKQWWVYTGAQLGVSGEREPEAFNIFGPAISGQIPIFNYGQAARLRLRAQLRQAQDRVAFKEIQVLSEVREAHKILQQYEKLLHNYHTLLPLQGTISQTSETLYNVMGLGLDKLLENKEAELQVYSHYILSLRNYWIARVELDRALGGKL